MIMAIAVYCNCFCSDVISHDFDSSAKSWDYTLAGAEVSSFCPATPSVSQITGHTYTHTHTFGLTPRLLRYSQLISATV